MSDDMSPWQKRAKRLEDQWFDDAGQGVKDTYVYRYFDEAGVLLYVGQTNNPARRHSGHKSRSPWFSLMARRELRGPVTKAWALCEEFVALGVESPRYNSQSANGHAGPGSTHWEEAMGAEFRRAMEAEPELWEAESEWLVRRMGQFFMPKGEVA